MFTKNELTFIECLNYFQSIDMFQTSCVADGVSDFIKPSVLRVTVWMNLIHSL